jgi:hypothetical protein
LLPEALRGTQSLLTLPLDAASIDCIELTATEAILPINNNTVIVRANARMSLLVIRDSYRSNLYNFAAGKIGTVATINLEYSDIDAGKPPQIKLDLVPTNSSIFVYVNILHPLF